MEPRALCVHAEQTLPTEPRPSPRSQAGSGSHVCQVLEQRSQVKGDGRRQLGSVWGEQPGEEDEPWKMKGPNHEVG